MEQNFHLVTDRLFISDSNSGYSISFLKSKKITHILICASEVPVRFPNDFNYKKLLIKDKPSFDIEPFLDDGVEFIHEGLTNGGRVLVYCNQGISRSPSFVIGYFIRFRHMSLEFSLRHIRSVHPDAFPNSGFMKFLRKYERKYLESSSISCKCHVF